MADKKMTKRIWTCKIGEVGGVKDGADLPMRQIVEAGYFALTGEEPDFIFSGWGDILPEEERAFLENREPWPERMRSDITMAQETELCAEIKELKARLKSLAC